MTEPVVYESAEGVVWRVAQALGGLTGEEHAVVYGAAAALQATSSDDAPPPSSIQEMAGVLTALRTAPCRWCHTGLSGHSVDLMAQSAEVRCPGREIGLPTGQWLAGPVPTSALRVVLAGLGWVVVPLASVGLLSWLMPAIAGIARRRAAWGIAAAVLFAALVVGLSLPGDVGGLILTVNWLGAAVYGGFQIKPWLAGRPSPARAPAYPGSRPLAGGPRPF